MRCLASQVRRSDPHVGQKFSTFDYPGATFTGATGINQRGDILGRYTNADNLFHGFLMTGFRPHPPRRRLRPALSVQYTRPRRFAG